MNQKTIIHHYDEVKDIIEKIETKVYDPALKGQDITTYILEKDEMESFLQGLMKGDPNIKDVLGLTLNISESKSTIFMKSLSLENILHMIFHERGHVANKNLLHELDLDNLTRTSYDESLAYSYEFWAKQEIPNLTDIRYDYPPDITFAVFYEQHQTIFQDNLHYRVGLHLIMDTMIEIKSLDFCRIYTHLKSCLYSGNIKPASRVLEDIQKGFP